MGKFVDLRPLPTTLLILFVVGPLVSIFAIPVLLFFVDVNGIFGFTALSTATQRIAAISVVVAMISPVAALWIGNTSRNIGFLWIAAMLTTIPAFITVLLLLWPFF